MGDPLRIAHVVGKMVGGGVEQVVMNYYRHIDRSLVQFDFIVDSDSSLVPWEEIESLGGRIFIVPPYQSLAAYLRELERLFREQSWTIVHSHINSLSVFPLGAAKRAGVPVRIAHSHSTSGRGELAKNALKCVLRTQANRYPTHRFACSRLAGEWLFGHGADFETVPNAIELDSFLFDGEARVSARSELGLSADQFVLLHVGRFSTQKNQAFLLDAFARLIEVRPNSVLLLVGTGDLLLSIEERAMALSVADKVRFLGQRDDVWRLYMAADAFVLPSLYEGLGIVAVEAQVAGLPCFLSARVTEEVDISGTCHFLSVDRPSSVDAWANCIARVPLDNRLTVNRNAFDEYDIDSAANMLLRRYEALYDLAQTMRN